MLKGGFSFVFPVFCGCTAEQNWKSETSIEASGTLQKIPGFVPHPSSKIHNRRKILGKRAASRSLVVGVSETDGGGSCSLSQ